MENKPASYPVNARILGLCIPIPSSLPQTCCDNWFLAASHPVWLSLSHSSVLSLSTPSLVRPAELKDLSLTVPLPVCRASCFSISQFPTPLWWPLLLPTPSHSGTWSMKVSPEVLSIALLKNLFCMCEWKFLTDMALNCVSDWFLNSFTISFFCSQTSCTNCCKW